MGKRAVPERTPPARLNGSLMPRGLREKLRVAFCLMSVVPLLVLGYILTNYVFPHIKSPGELSLVTGLAAGITFLGLAVARGLILPVIKMSWEAQAIAEGQLEREVDARAPDEVGQLGVALNQITQRVRENMTQLRAYGEQTHHLNLEINRRILALSNLLQVSNLITQSTPVEETITFILEKLTQLDEAEFNCLLATTEEENTFLVRAAVGADSAQVQALLHTKLVAPWLAKVLTEHRILVLDGREAASRGGEMFQQLVGMTNGVCQPMVSMGKGVGLLISANRKENFTFEEETLELLKVFGKQMAIAVENDLLTRRAEELKVTDELTGLYNASYMTTRLDEEVRRAIRYHRPCSLAILNLDGFRQLQELQGGLAAEGVLKQIAQLLKSQIGEVDRAGRIGPDEFSLILPERNKREAIELAEAIRRRIEQTVFANGPQPMAGGLTLSGGVSENPLDGSTAGELFAKAKEAVKLAKLQGKNRIVASG